MTQTMSKMTEVLTKTIIDGHREEIVNTIVERFVESEDYERYVTERIERVILDMV